MQKFIKSVLPHIVALVVFAVVSAAMFYPELSDKALRQGDVINHEGMVQDIDQYIATYGEHPNWSGRMFGGMPSYTMSMDHGFHLFSLVNLHHAENSILMLFLAMAGFYLMLLLMGVNAWVAIVGSLAYGLSTYFPIIISAGHITKMWALQWVAPLIGSIWYTYRGRMWTGGALSALFTALLVGSSHHQITYYFLFVIAALVIMQLVVSFKTKLLSRFAKASAVLLLAASLGVGSNIVGLYYIADYTKVSTRGGANETANETNEKDPNKTSGLDRDYITAWSYGKSETFNLFIPNFAGGGRNFKEGGDVDHTLSKYQVPKDYYKNLPSYHGSQPFTEGPVYIGAVIIFLALFALFLLPGEYKWWIIAPTLLALLLAWGHNLGWFTNLFIDYFPLYNKFRVPSMILVVVEWSIPLLASLGLCKLYKMTSGLPITYTPPVKTENALFISTAIAGGFALISALILPALMSFTGANDGAMGLPNDILVAMESERAALLRADSLRTLLLILATALVLWLYIKGAIKKMAIMVACVAALVIFDLFGVDRRYVSSDDFVSKREAKTVVATDADKTILQDKSDFRVADFSTGNPFSSSRASYFHRSIGGYHAAKMGRYQELIDAHLSKMNHKVYDMLNTKYFITSEGVEQNPSAIGSATVIDSVIWVNSTAQELQMLGSQEFNPSYVAIVNEKYRDALKSADISAIPDSNDYVQLISYEPNRLKYEVQTQNNRLILFSEIFHKDWVVSIDSELATPIEVDYVLRGVVVPSGVHTVEWVFVQPNSKVMMSIAAVSTSAIILWLIAIFALWIHTLIISKTKDE